MGEYVLNIALDLGSDTLKAAFAYVDDDGAAHCGKLVGDSFSTRVAIPAVARYDENKKEWRYGDDVGRGDAKSFVTVVKIKSLLSLVEKVTPSAAVRGAETKQKAEGIAARNRQYYARSDHFPRFAFPRRSDGRDYARGSRSRGGATAGTTRRSSRPGRLSARRGTLRKACARAFSRMSPSSS